MSLYERLGGKPAVDKAVEIFYQKVATDPHVAHFFTNLDMVAQSQKLSSFISMVLGGPVNYTGHDMRRAHAFLKLDDSHFDNVAGHLQETLMELQVPNAEIAQVMELVDSVKDDVLNR